MRRVTLVILLTAVVVGALGGGFWWWRHSQFPARVNGAAFETDMTAGLVRGVLHELGTGGPPVCFLAFGEGRTPPSPSFIARFAKTYPELRSSGSSVSPPNGKFFEVSNGKPGLIVRVISFREITPSVFEAVVAFSNLPAGRDRFVYRVAKQGGEWVVLNRKPE
jgi:hypothetical protein